ncbi:MAG: hypothetical protein OXF77_00895 [Thaumarchaeota archaeon]|nr:hypothetical protein [Nitrososphaerota archaeon]
MKTLLIALLLIGCIKIEKLPNDKHGAFALYVIMKQCIIAKEAQNRAGIVKINPITVCERLIIKRHKGTNIRVLIKKAKKLSN